MLQFETIVRVVITLAILSFSAPSAAQGFPEKLPVKRGPASFVQGFKVLKKNCPIYRAPSSISKKAFRVREGRRLWLTAMDSQWLIATTKKKKQQVYLHSSCVL